MVSFSKPIGKPSRSLELSQSNTTSLIPEAFNVPTKRGQLDKDSIETPNLTNFMCVFEINRSKLVKHIWRPLATAQNYIWFRLALHVGHNMPEEGGSAA